MGADPQIEAFRKLDNVATAPMVACFRAVAKGYPELEYETLLVIAWACFVKEREGAYPVGKPIPFEWKTGGGAL